MEYSQLAGMVQGSPSAPRSFIVFFGFLESRTCSKYQYTLHSLESSCVTTPPYVHDSHTSQYYVVGATTPKHLCYTKCVYVYVCVCLCVYMVSHTTEHERAR